jgi:hypothetical protein
MNPYQQTYQHPGDRKSWAVKMYTGKGVSKCKVERSRKAKRVLSQISGKMGECIQKKQKKTNKSNSQNK